MSNNILFCDIQPRLSFTRLISFMKNINPLFINVLLGNTRLSVSAFKKEKALFHVRKPYSTNSCLLHIICLQIEHVNFMKNRCSKYSCIE
jgi:hypothetical protein